ncbi:hypothetical protein [Kineococcus radiotolerans]|uniref:hypothetical protein n=1 Tax=Kineococcus radiotolerans TaxID=131568 RepID=UPI0012FEFC92|nr:hypothetical protein [Kineococcus radiotolerans]
MERTDLSKSAPQNRKRGSRLSVSGDAALVAAGAAAVGLFLAGVAFIAGPTASFHEPATSRFDEVAGAAAARVVAGAGGADQQATFAASGASVSLSEVVAPGYSGADAPAAARGFRAVLDFTVANDHDVKWWQRLTLHSWQPTETVHVCRLLTVTPATTKGIDGARTVSVSTLDPDTKPSLDDGLFSPASFMSKEKRNAAWARDCAARSSDVDLNTGEQLSSDLKAASLRQIDQIGWPWSGVGQLQVAALQDALRANASASWTAQERLRQALSSTASPSAAGIQVASDERYATAALMLRSRTCVTAWVGPDFDQVWAENEPDRCEAKAALTTVPPSQPPLPAPNE